MTDSPGPSEPAAPPESLRARLANRLAQVRDRYGPRYLKLAVAVTALSLFVPIPGSSAASLSLVILIAETHRAVAERIKRRNG